MEEQFADRSSAAVTQLVDTRRAVLEKLSVQYRNLMPALTKLEGQKREYQEKAAEVEIYVRERMFWIKSGPPLSGSSLLEVPSGFQWIISDEHRREYERALKGGVSRARVRCSAIILIAVMLLVMRHRIVAALKSTGIQIRRISTDRYALTLQALLWTVLLALPCSLVLALLWWVGVQADQPSDWLCGTTYGLQWSAAELLIWLHWRALPSRWTGDRSLWLERGTSGSPAEGSLLVRDRLHSSVDYYQRSDLRRCAAIR